eukprot:7516460-Pyramimonas_sp.AAC.1
MLAKSARMAACSSSSMRLKGPSAPHPPRCRSTAQKGARGVVLERSSAAVSGAGPCSRPSTCQVSGAGP